MGTIVIRDSQYIFKKSKYVNIYLFEHYTLIIFLWGLGGKKVEL